MSVAVAGYALGVAYLIVPIGLFGRSLGCVAAGVRVVSRDGAPAGMGRAALRFIGLLLCAATFYAGSALAAFTPEKRGLQDYVAGTKVVYEQGVSGGRKAAMVLLGLFSSYWLVLGLIFVFNVTAALRGAKPLPR